MLGITKHTETEERHTMTNAEHESENSKKVLHARRESNERERDQPRASLPPFREAPSSVNLSAKATLISGPRQPRQPLASNPRMLGSRGDVSVSKAVA